MSDIPNDADEVAAGSEPAQPRDAELRRKGARARRSLAEGEDYLLRLKQDLTQMHTAEQKAKYEAAQFSQMGRSDNTATGARSHGAQRITRSKQLHERAEALRTLIAEQEATNQQLSATIDECRAELRELRELRAADH